MSFVAVIIAAIVIGGLILVLATGGGIYLMRQRAAVGVAQSAVVAEQLGLSQVNQPIGKVPAWFAGEVDGVTVLLACLRVREGSGTYSRHETNQMCRIVVPVSAPIDGAVYRKKQAASADRFEARFTGDLAAVPAGVRPQMSQFVDEHGYLWLSSRSRGDQVALARDAARDAPAILLHSQEVDTETPDLRPIKAAIRDMGAIARGLERS
ncbi:MAG: hypothetical protein AAFV53_11525 [Myxococcota bacterium]